MTTVKTSDAVCFVRNDERADAQILDLNSEELDDVGGGIGETILVKSGG